MQIQKNVNLTPEVKIFLQVNLDPYSVTASILKGSFFILSSPKSNWDQIKLTMTHLNMEMKVSIQSLAAVSIIFKSNFVKLFFFFLNTKSAELFHTGETLRKCILKRIRYSTITCRIYIIHLKKNQLSFIILINSQSSTTKN